MKASARAMLGVLAVVYCALPARALETSGAVIATTLLKTTTAWNGAKLTWPQGQAEATMLSIEIAPGGETGWHLHPMASFGIVVQGTLEVTLKDGRVKRLQQGEVLAEVVDTLHNGRNVGEGPVRLVVFYVGNEGAPLSVKSTDP